MGPVVVVVQRPLIPGDGGPTPPLAADEKYVSANEPDFDSLSKSISANRMRGKMKSLAPNAARGGMRQVGQEHLRT